MQASPGILQSFKAGETIPAYRVVGMIVGPTAHTVKLHITSTSLIFGVSQDQVDTNGFVPVAMQYGCSSKVVCNVSIAAGDIVAPATDAAGKIKSVTLSNTGTATPTLGIALQAGSTNSVIEVLLQPNNATRI